jgi:ParB/RepB/Spo0J family partition protein
VHARGLRRHAVLAEDENTLRCDRCRRLIRAGEWYRTGAGTTRTPPCVSRKRVTERMASTAAAPTALGELRPLLELVPSPLNPRKHFDKQKLEELAASIKSKGIIEPLIVRERPASASSRLSPASAGTARRRSPSTISCPSSSGTLSDVEVLELMAIENSQRDDLHPLEEADGFKALMKADPSYTPKAIAAKIGKSNATSSSGCSSRGSSRR